MSQMIRILLGILQDVGFSHNSWALGTVLATCSSLLMIGSHCMICRTCKRNPNKEFADCSIPQGKSNEEINLELGISESSLCEEGDDVDATGDSRLMYDGAQGMDSHICSTYKLHFW